MPLVIILIFIAIFAVIAPVLVLWSGAGKAASNKHVLAALDTALGSVGKKEIAPAVDVRRSETFSSIPWLHTLLSKVDLIPRLQKILNQAEVKWTPGALLLMSIAFFGLPGYLVYLRTDTIILGFLIGAALAFLPLSFVLIKRGQRFKKFEAGLPDALDLMTSALRVGHSFNSALSLVSRECADPIGSEFRTCFEEQNFGLELRVAFDNLIARIPLQDLKIVVTAILIQRESGGNLAEVLEKTAYVIRQRFRLKRQVMVHTAQGRMTGWILTILPVVLGLGLFIINPDTESLLWKREIGIKLLIAGAGMLVVGTLIIQKIVRMDV
jgi:tight adherence protein B